MQLPVINTPLWLKFVGQLRHAQVWRAKHESASNSYNMQKKKLHKSRVIDYLNPGKKR